MRTGVYCVAVEASGEAASCHLCCDFSELGTQAIRPSLRFIRVSLTIVTGSNCEVTGGLYCVAMATQKGFVGGLGARDSEHR